MRIRSVPSVLMMPAAAWAQPVFEPLGFPPPLPGYSEYAEAQALSADGQIVAGMTRVWDAFHGYAGQGPFVWTTGGGYVEGPLVGGSGRAAAVGTNGLVFGDAWESPLFQGWYFWRSGGGTPPQLGAAPANSLQFLAKAASSDGTKFLVHPFLGAPQVSFRGSEASGWELMPDPQVAGFELLEAADLSDSGEVVCGAWIAGGVLTGFVWREGAGYEALPHLPGSTGWTLLSALSGDGRSGVGAALDAAGVRRMIRWTRGGGVEPLPQFGSGISHAMHISDDGWVVVGQTDAQDGVFVWDPVSGVRDLKAYLLALGVSEVSGWTLKRAAGLSADGRTILVQGKDPQGRSQGFVARIPAFCYANCDGSTGAPALNVADFGCFLSKFAAGESYANCDGSTGSPALNVADFGCFLSRFASGCP